MGLYSDLKAAFTPAKRERMVSPAGVSIGGRVPYPKRGEYLNHVQNGYKANPIVAACVGLLSSTMNEPPLGVANDDGTVNVNHPLAVTFRRPNPYMGQAQFWAQCWQFLSLSGNAYLKLIRGDMGNLSGFLVYGDAHVAPIRDENGWITGYVYESQNVKQYWSAADVIHIRHPLYIDPLRLDMGMSPIEVCWDKVQTYNELQSSIYSLVASNMVPSGLLTAPGDVPKTAVDQIRQQLQKRRNSKGMERTDPLVLGAGMNYVQMGLDAQRIQATETLRDLEAAICAAFRIHPAVIGSSAGLSISTYNNLQSAYAEYTTLLRVPMWNALEEQLEAGLSRDYPGVQLAFDLSQVQALQPDVDEASIIAQFTNNLTTQNETRAKLGYEPVEDGDKYIYEVVPPAPGFGLMAKPGTTEHKDQKAPYDTIDFTPPQGVRDEAQKGLDWRTEYGRGGTEVGIARARDLSNGRNISPDTARRMAAYFSRHEIDKQGEGWEPGQDGFPSNGRIAWALWGGDAGQTWANKLVRQMNAEDEDEGRNNSQPDDVKFTVSADGIKWNEDYAVKAWQDEQAVIDRAAKQTEPYVIDFLDKAQRGAVGKAKARKGTKANPADGINVQQLVNEYMTATESIRQTLARQIIELTLEGTNVDFTVVQSFIDDVIKAQTRETADMMKDSGETLKREVSKIAEENAGDANKIAELITAKFETIKPSRAKMIAKTTVRAQSTVVQNETISNLNQREDVADRKFVMVWLTQRDNDVRPSHERLDGKWVEMGEPWTKYNSGITRGPGIGPDASEVINCRCIQRPTRRSRIRG